MNEKSKKILLSVVIIAVLIFFFKGTLFSVYENNILAKNCVEISPGVINCDLIDTGRSNSTVTGTEFGISGWDFKWDILSPRILNENILNKDGWLNICSGNPATQCQIKCNSEIQKWWESTGNVMFPLGADKCPSRGYDFAYYVQGPTIGKFGDTSYYCCWINLDKSDINWYGNYYTNRECTIHTSIGDVKGVFTHGYQPLCQVTDANYTSSQLQQFNTNNEMRLNAVTFYYNTENSVQTNTTTPPSTGATCSLSTVYSCRNNNLVQYNTFTDCSTMSLVYEQCTYGCSNGACKDYTASENTTTTTTKTCEFYQEGSDCKVSTWVYIVGGVVAFAIIFMR